MPQRPSRAPVPLLAIAIVSLIVPGLASSAGAQCELRWRLLNGSSALPALSNWAVAADPVRGELYAVEPARGPGIFLHSRVWRSTPRGWRNVAPQIGVSWPTRSVAFDTHRRLLLTVQPRPLEGPGMDVWVWSGSLWSVAPNAPDAPTPPNRTGGSLVYDAVRGATLLFGGRTPQGALLNDLWAWDGERWSLLDAGGEGSPSGRAGAAFVFDPARGVFVLHGDTSAPYQTDTWEWDGTAWALRAHSGPRIYGSSQMAFDPSRGRVVLLDWTGHLAEPIPLREWNGSEWLLIPGSETARRPGAALIADPRTGLLTLIGCSEHVTCETDLAWTGESWVEVVHGPRPRRARAAYDPGRGVLVLTGGAADWDYAGDARFDSVWEWSGQFWSRRPGSELGGAAETQPVYFPPRSAVLSVGRADQLPGFAHLWDGVQWENVESPAGVPAPDYRRTNHAVAYDRDRGVAVLFGGRRDVFGEKDDTWEFTGEGWISVLPPIRPSARHSHAMAYDPVRRRTLLFGGVGYNMYNSELWSYDAATQTWAFQPQSGPPAMAQASMAFDTHRGVALLFGGLTAAGPRNSVWQWDGSEWTFLNLPGPRPSPRAAAAFVYDPDRRGTILFGGYTFNLSSAFHPYFGDTWILHNPADHDIDGGINSGDIAAFLETWLRSIQEGAPDADFDLSGAVTSGDISAFLTAWHAAIANGC